MSTSIKLRGDLQSDWAALFECPVMLLEAGVRGIPGSVGK